MRPLSQQELLPETSPGRTDEGPTRCARVLKDDPWDQGRRILWQKMDAAISCRQFFLPLMGGAPAHSIAPMSASPRRARLVRIAGLSVFALLALYGLLLIPERAPPVPVGAGREPFAWQRDAFWNQLEAQFREARKLGCDKLGGPMQAGFDEVQRALSLLELTNLPPTATLFDLIETNFFQLAPMIGACPDRLPAYLQLHHRLRRSVKRQSERWPMDATETRQRLYQILHGGRAAVEEAMLQAPAGGLPALLLGEDEPSAAPSATVLGVKIHSGDILLSRGGAATSALIARGNDYPGNFSHVALAQVDERSGQVSVIESHIERGVVAGPMEDYLKDKKLRIMLLRLRADLPALRGDALLPHKAASVALRDAASRHIPYDFAMDHHDPSKQFCSEVAAVAYQQQGVKLWMGISQLSSRGVTAWLSALGARHFETQEPADLEYDPQLRVVAEWRDPETLFKDHVDNAVIDALLESAESGERLGHDWTRLPLARLAKGWSWVLNCFGGVGPIPEGMSATTALRVQRLKALHAGLVTGVLSRAGAFKAERGYAPPYWELVRFAREARR